ncbi:MAG: hypothetical protein U0236_05015 [Nitrospira sp.]
MSLRFTIGLFAIVVAASCLTSCQPPTPKIAKAEEPVSMLATSNGAATVTGLGGFNPAGKSDEPIGLLTGE